MSHPPLFSWVALWLGARGGRCACAPGPVPGGGAGHWVGWHGSDVVSACVVPSALIAHSDLDSECKTFGEIKKIMIFDRHPDGVVSIKFADVESAHRCVKVMNGRFFAGRKLEAGMWDGKWPRSLVACPRRWPHGPGRRHAPVHGLRLACGECCAGRRTLHLLRDTPCAGDGPCARALPPRRRLGHTNYKIEESELEREERLKKWETDLG